MRMAVFWMIDGGPWIKRQLVLAFTSCRRMNSGGSRSAICKIIGNQATDFNRVLHQFTTEKSLKTVARFPIILQSPVSRVWSVLWCQGVTSRDPNLLRCSSCLLLVCFRACSLFKCTCHMYIYINTYIYISIYIHIHALSFPSAP